ncbi:MULTISPECIES: RipA family octameric membrane protein [Kordiimonas]|jgi:hypothetical protein|uniref:RipA family octameric membrane protein n=1 Tax=Kordiimonas TaxID=288021 RepID=UPI00257FE767|nr:hypothetical protein [Kordiimonas sp. UBA4487]
MSNNLEIYALYLSTAEKVSDRRQQANGMMLSINAALLAFYGAIGGGGITIPLENSHFWALPIPIAGFLVCFYWGALLRSYGKLNAAKFSLLLEMEKDLPIDLLARERKIYSEKGHNSFSKIEMSLPWIFGALYLLFVASPCLPAL